MISLVLLLAVFLRLFGANQSFWLDEAISALTSQKAFPYQWSGITGDFQPPLYYIVLHLYMKIGFTNELVLRIPSIIFGILAVWSIYRFTNQLFGKNIAIVAALLLATSQFHIYYSQELRMYSLLAFISIEAMSAFFNRKWTVLTIWNILGLYSSYMYFLMFIPQVLWSFTRVTNKSLRPFGVSIFLSLLSFVPWIPAFRKQLETAAGIVAYLPQWKNLSSLPFWGLLPQIFLKFTLGRIDFNDNSIYLMILVLLIVFYGYVLYRLRAHRDEKTRFIAYWLICPSIGSIIISFFIPISGVWRLIFLLPAYLVLLSVALSKIKLRNYYIAVMLAINLTSYVFYMAFPRYQRENWRDAVKYIDSSKLPVLFTVENGFAPYIWYSKKDVAVCGPESLRVCTQGNSLMYVSYLEDLFDSGKKLRQKLSAMDLLPVQTKNFDGVGLVFIYENSH